MFRRHSAAPLSLALLAASPFAQEHRVQVLREQVPPNFEQVFELATADIDGDGDVDLLTAERFDGFRALFNDGLAKFTSGTIQFSVEERARFAPSDVDGDGDIDLAVGGDPAHLQLNDGNGVFTASPSFPSLTAFQQVALGDLDGDGDPDAVLAGTGEATASLNDGHGSFTLTGGNLPCLDDVAVIRVGDLDLDGDLDVYVGGSDSSSAGPGNDRLLANDGAGSLNDISHQLPSLPWDTSDAELLDLNGDGSVDLVRALGTEGLRADLNTGGFFSLAPNQPPSDGRRIRGLATGDLNGDDATDVFAVVDVTLYVTAQSQLFYGDGAGGWIESSAELPDLPVEDTYAAVMADLDGDGDADLATAAKFQQTRVLLGDGQGALQDVTSTLPPSSTITESFALGDVDGNGYDDMLVGTGYSLYSVSSSEPRQLFLQVGDGSWIDASSTLPTVGGFGASGSIASTHLRDLDGDGDLDGFWISGGLGGSNVLLNDGSGTFTLKGFDVVDDGTDAELIDLDQDGDLDAVVTEFGAYSFTRLNAGDATFPTRFDFSSKRIAAIDSGDLNGDGREDIFAGIWDQPSRIWVSNGAGQLIFLQEPVPGESPNTTDVVLGDFDADGDLDSVLATSGIGSVYRNDGGTWTTEPIAAKGRLTAVDFDQDGDVDVLSSFERDGLFQNDGSGAFTQLPLFDAGAIEGFSVPFGVRDLDLDGDLDLIAGHRQDRILWNLERQIATRRLPNVGEPLTIDLWGAPGSPWFLAWALAPVNTELPPFGTLKLATFSLQTLGSGFMDLAGEATFEALLPSTPGLVGLTVYAQGLLGDPLQFGGLERIYISGF